MLNTSKYDTKYMKISLLKILCVTDRTFSDTPHPLYFRVTLHHDIGQPPTPSHTQNFLRDEIYGWPLIKSPINKIDSLQCNWPLKTSPCFYINFLLP